MKAKPTVEILNESGNYAMIASVEHQAIKEFVWQQVMADKRFVPAYMVYQTLLLLSGMFFLTRAIVLAVKGESIYLVVSAATLVFCFTLLIALHELLHALALKLAGAPKVAFGAILRKFIFFAEADRFVLGRAAFFFVAFTPLVVIQVVALAGIIHWFSSPYVYFFLLLMTVHSFFCAGDVALAAVFNRYPGREMFTYDDRQEKKSYYFLKKENRVTGGEG